MTIDTILFDMDGVLIDAKWIHFKALNDALPEEFKVSVNDHLNKYDGYPTKTKLRMIEGLPEEMVDHYFEKKQINTVKALQDLPRNEKLIELFDWLKSNRFNIAVCSNSIMETILISLERIGISDYVDLIHSNESVSNPKPHPEMYWRSMISFNAFPENTLILEDSPPGLKAAHTTGAHVMRINSPSQVNVSNVKSHIENIGENHTMKWTDKSLNVLIPMAGEGSRFAQAGYTFPKPLIDVNGKPMIQVVHDNLNIDANFIFVVRKEHIEKYNVDKMLSVIAPSCKIVVADGLTEGAACTALLAKEHIDNDNPLVFANSDQFVEWDSVEFMYKMQEKDLDGGIITFHATHPKWSFVKTDDHGMVTEVAEKNPISDQATAGIYYWKKGSDFVKYANRMIEKNDRVNNEFYVCPVYNHAIADDKKVGTFDISEMWGLGTPEDLSYFLSHK